MDQNQLREVNEAVRAADYALGRLEAAGECLRSARNWGIVDILGGGFLSTFVKRKRMNEASECMLEARRALASFRKELQDVDTKFPLSVDEAESELLAFADYLMDGIFVDLIVQDKIARAQKQVETAIVKVKEARNRLQEMVY